MQLTSLRFPTSVTKKGQITLPKKVRDKHGISVSSKVIVVSDKAGIHIEPTKDIVSLAGAFRPKKMKPVMQAREVMEKDYKRF